MSLTVLTGGARSGKSGIAVRRARRSARPVVFVATGEPRDHEMAERIARHRSERPAGWATVEAPHELAHAVTEQEPEAMLIVDCLSLWVANLIERGDDEAAIVEHATRVAQACLRRGPSPTIIVTNEIGSGLVPMHPLGRSYRDVLGRVNVEVARHADLVQLVVVGRTMTLDPVEDVVVPAELPEGDPHG